MSYYDTTFYCNAGDQSTTGYYSVAKRASGAAVVAGQLCRQFTAPAVNSERVFICIIAGTTAVATDATWVLTRGAKTVDGTATWMECTGIAAVNGDKINTVNWTAAKAIGTPTLGTIIQRNSGTSYQICTTAGTLGATEPAFSDTAGVTTTETSATTVWTSLGPVTNFTGGQAPHARLTNACATNWFAAGNTIYVGDNHAESQSGNITITPAGVVSAVGKILCHNHLGSYPPTPANLATGATVLCTSASVIQFNPSGGLYVYGVTFQAGSGSNNCWITLGPCSAGLFFDNCSLQLTNTNASGLINFGTSSGATNLTLNNTSLKFGNVGQFIILSPGCYVWQNTSLPLAAGSSVPTNLFSTNNTAAIVVIEAVDLSAVTGNLIIVSSPLSGPFMVKDCKLVAGASIAAPVSPGFVGQFVRSDSAATGYKSARYAYEGTETTETSITRVGGAADPTGQAQSRKIVTTANSQWLRPFKAEPYAIWNPRTAANVTVTVCGTVNAGALPNNDDVWLEVEYLGDSASTLGKIITTTKSNLLAANAAVASDGSTWNNTAFSRLDASTAISTTVSSDNLTATHTSTVSNCGAYSTEFYTTGKFYFEFTVGTNLSSVAHLLGAITSNGSLNNMVFSGTNCVDVQVGSGSTGIIFSNGANTGRTLGAISPGDVVGVALDLGARKGWLRKNSGLWNGQAIGSQDPVAGVGGVTLYASVGYAPAIGFNTSSASGSTMTLNSGQSTFANAAPSGYSGVPGVWSPFKLTTTLSSPQPGQAGYIHVRPRVAKPSATFYLDPQVTLS